MSNIEKPLDFANSFDNCEQYIKHLKSKGYKCDRWCDRWVPWDCKYYCESPNGEIKRGRSSFF